MFKIYGGLEKFTQWTKDQKLIMSRLPIGSEVLFYNDPNEDKPLVSQVYEITDSDGNKLNVCDVPSILLTKTNRIKVCIPSKVLALYGNIHMVAGQREKYFEVEPASKPDGYVYDEIPSSGSSDGDHAYVLPIATESTLGGVKAIEKTESMNQQVGVDDNGFLWVEASTNTGYPTLVSIEVVSPPIKLSYQVGDLFDPFGMVVEALYSNGTRATVSQYNYTISPSIGFSEEDTFVAIQYSDNGVVATTTQPIFVKYYSDTFADNDWETIIKVCQEKVVPDTWLAGDSKSMTMGGYDCQIRIIGKNHDDYADESGKAPLTFEMVELYPTSSRASGLLMGETYWGGWEIRKNITSTWLNGFPDVVKNSIKSVYKPTYSGSGVKNVIDTAFILSENEIFGEVKNAKIAEGTQYEYYAAGNSKIKNLNGTPSKYLTRSISSQTKYTQVSQEGYGNAPCICYVSGESSGYQLISDSGYVALAFCF